MKKLLTLAYCWAALAALPVGALTFGDANSIGWYNPPEPASPANEVAYINNLIAQGLNTGPTLVGGVYYTRTGNYAGLPTATATGGIKDDTSPSNTGINVTGFTYLIAKYDGPNGAGYVWNVTGLTSVNIPANMDGSGLTDPNPNSNDYGDPLKGGLSHWSLYNPGTSVPDAGATMSHLGLGLVGLGLVSRRTKLS